MPKRIHSLPGMAVTGLVFTAVMPGFLNAQHLALGRIEQQKIDSMRHTLNSSHVDSVRYEASITLSNFYQFKNLDSSFFYAKIASEICRENGKRLAEAESQKAVMYYYDFRGEYSNAWEVVMNALEIARNPASEKTHYLYPAGGNFKKQRLEILSYLEVTLGDLLLHTNNYRESIQQYEKAIAISNEMEDYRLLHHRYNHMGWAYTGLDMPDSALFYTLLAERTAKEKNLRYNIEIIYNDKGSIFLKKGLVKQAKESYFEALKTAKEDSNRSSTTDACLGLSACFLAMRQKDSSLYYALEARNLLPTYSEVYERLYQAYELNNEKDSAFKYLVLAWQAKNDYNKEHLKNLAGFQQLLLHDRLKLIELEKEKIQTRSKIRTYLFSGGIGVLLLLSAVFYRISRHRQKDKIKIEKAYSELKDTQHQLVQREKMASLGELTAGIAHEIQNPLNFVNNFSDVNAELVDEANAEIDKGNIIEVKAILNSIKDNEQKINHHGKRADAIVKGMLQHSRSSSGKKEPTDINALAEEYLRLAYHGMRAKDKSFNATTKTEFDNSIGKVNVVPQEIGRVILNLINNAFYAVNEKQKQSTSGYEPIVRVSTKKIKDKVEIKVKDNGSGIPEKILDKIFQPFFTTKPTGEGTGLGLSLAYDIVTKGHGGELKVETKEAHPLDPIGQGEGTAFIILL